MLAFPHCKINIGLNICEKRPDGYHNIETVFYPVPWCDVLEIMPAEKDEFVFAGISIQGSVDDNLCYKAYKIIKNDFDISPISLFLYKQIPTGAGLGGGSADAAFTLMCLNQLFSLKLSIEKLLDYANPLGSDCGFFLQQQALYATATGNLFSPINLSLAGKVLVIVKPPVHISTVEAYQQCRPTGNTGLLKGYVSQPLNSWKMNVKNEFEESIFEKYPILQNIKDKLYELGAEYAAMSGSGSAIYGIFQQKIDKKHFQDYDFWQGLLP